jgi:hypothetical protein
MTGTTFCDSAEFGVLVRAHRQALAEGGGLRRSSPADSAITRIFTSIGLDRVVPGSPAWTGLWPNGLSPRSGRSARVRPPARSPAGRATVISLPPGARFSKQLIRSYTQVVFNERRIGRAAEFFAPDLTWQGSTGPPLQGRDHVIALIGEVVGALTA